MHLLLHQQHHVYFMFRDTRCITNQKQRYVGVTVTSLRRNSEREIKLARDRVIDFGKYKGKMLGSLPSSYLKWVSKNLRAREFEEWAILADQVLLDPIYKDRIEWEFALNVLNGNNISSGAAKSIGAADSELQKISERFGWDNLDKVGWSKVDFDLLGTSKGGRIPRLVNFSDSDANTNTQPNQPPATSIIGSNGSNSSSSSSSSRTKRMERRARQKMRSRTTNEAQQQKDDNVVDIEEVEDDNINLAIVNPFPGRQALLRKAINHGSILS